MSRTKILAALILFQAALCAPARADDPVRPDRVLTPGAIRTTDATVVCQKDYSKSVRHTSLTLKKEIYHEYGAQWAPGKYEVDHLIPLGVGGADVKENLWPESRQSGEWNADRKDRLELKLHNMICAHRIDIREAQTAIASDWIDAYKRFCPTDQNCPPYQVRYHQAALRRREVPD